MWISGMHIENNPAELLSGIDPAVYCVQRQYVRCVSSLDTTTRGTEGAIALH